MQRSKDEASSTTMVHVHLPVTHGQHRTECVFADKVGVSRFRIKNIPVFHENAHFGDIVEAMISPAFDGTYHFTRVLIPKGNGTILFTYNDHEVFQRCAAIARQHRAFLEGAGASVKCDGKLLAIMSVPPRAWKAIETWFDQEIERGAIEVQTHEKPTRRVMPRGTRRRS